MDFLEQLIVNENFYSAPSKSLLRGTQVAWNLIINNII